MNPQHGLALVDMIEGTGQRIDLLRARVDMLDVYLTVAVGLLCLLSAGCLALALRVCALATKVDRLEYTLTPGRG